MQPVSLLSVDVAPVEKVLLHTPQMCVVDHENRPEHPHFGGYGPLRIPCLGFPRRMCEIAVEGHSPFVSDPSCVVLFRAGTVYSRRKIEATGERATVISVAPDLIEEVLDGLRGERPANPFAQVSAPLDSALHERSVALANRLANDPYYGILEAEEEALRLVVRTLGQKQLVGKFRTPVTAQARRHRDMVGALQNHMRCNVGNKLSLSTLSELTGVSTFHLCRIFKSVTGQSIYQYQLKLRLAAALSMAPDYRGNLSALAMDTGFSSHSHLATMFMRVYGQTPAQLALCGRSVLDPASLNCARN